MDKYRLGLRRNLCVLPKYNSCRSAIQCFYMQHCTSFLSVTKLAVYLSNSRVSKVSPIDSLTRISVRVCVTLSDVPRSTSYEVYISQLIWFARVSSHVADFNARNKSLTAKLLQQGYRYHKLRKTFSKFYRRH